MPQHSTPVDVVPDCHFLPRCQLCLNWHVKAWKQYWPDMWQSYLSLTQYSGFSWHVPGVTGSWLP